MKRVFIVLLLVASAAASAQNGISVSEIKKHIAYLASDELKGRGTGSEGEKLAAEYIIQNFQKDNLTPKGNGNSFYYDFHFKPKKADSTQAELPERNANDIAGYLDNGAENTVIIGAHYDHLGTGEDGNSLDANSLGKIHNGADDNASGTAGVLELARYFSANDRKEKFNFLFICFSGEELGLYGSKKFCENPTVDFSKVNYMLNMDMIGRLNDSTMKLIIYGVGTAPDWVSIIDKIPSEFNMKKDSSGIGPSDQTSFYLKNIPALHFFTGQHSDYHKPSDDADKINYEGEKKVLEYMLRVIEATEQLPKLKFLETKNPQQGVPKYKITMGVMPDYTYEGKGMRIDGVTQDRPASKAGIQKGDVVVMFGEDKIGDVMDYMKALAKHNKGDTVPVTILREGKEIELNVTF